MGACRGLGSRVRAQLGFQGVYRVPPGGGAPQLLVDRLLFDQPNGLCFSPDEKLLYINDTVQTLIRVFDVAADGSLSGGRMFASGVRSSLEQGVPDGMKCDHRGNVWVTAPGGVWVYAPSGDLLGKVRAPEKVANLAWGGPEFRTLFLTATHSVYRIETKVGPRREPYMNARSATPAGAVRSSQGVESQPPSSQPSLAQNLTLDPKRCALIIQDMQNDVIGEGGAFASSGAPAHAREQNVVENTRRLAAAARARGVAVIHVWFVVEPGAPGLTLNAPLFEGIADSKAMVRGSWGAAPVSGLEPQPGDFVVEKMRMSAWEGSRLETILRAQGRDMIIDTGAWTNMSIEHTARTGADKGYFIDRAGGLLLDDERGMASRLHRLRDAKCRRRHERRGRHQGARMSRRPLSARLARGGAEAPPFAVLAAREFGLFRRGRGVPDEISVKRGPHGTSTSRICGARHCPSSTAQRSKPNMRASAAGRSAIRSVTLSPSSSVWRCASRSRSGCSFPCPCGTSACPTSSSNGSISLCSRG